MNDRPRLGRLCAQMADMKQILPMMLTVGPDGRRSFAGMIPYRPEYVTGFLFGDACLFYSVTWRDWSLAADTPTTRPAARRRP